VLLCLEKEGIQSFLSCEDGDIHSKHFWERSRSKIMKLESIVKILNENIGPIRLA
jgi:hypothetical protein